MYICAVFISGPKYVIYRVKWGKTALFWIAVPKHSVFMWEAMIGDFPDGPVGGLSLPMQGFAVGSLVWKLRSHMLHGVAQVKNK